MTADDLKDCLSKNNLPPDYATQFIKRARGARWWSNAITFGEFKTQLGESEKDVVRAFCQLDVDSRGSIDISKIKGAPHMSSTPAAPQGDAQHVHEQLACSLQLAAYTFTEAQAALCRCAHTCTRSTHALSTRFGLPFSVCMHSTLTECTLCGVGLPFSVSSACTL